MTTDSVKQTAAGWYVDKRWPGEQRRWDGAKWLDQWRPVPPSRGMSPVGWMVAGLVLAALLGMLALVAFAVDTNYGWPALWIAVAVSATVFNIGVIAKAVEVGVRASRY